MGDTTPPEVANAAATVFHTRSYQQELLEESLRSNLIIALDTGSGKTHIAVLRMKHEAEREPRKVSWFFAPTVALVEQQCDVIRKAIPVPVCMISGASEPNQWKDRDLWRRVLESHRIIVSTPQVLLDALLHGYVDLGMDIGLLVYDEAHHAIAKHPYNMIMQQFYFNLNKRTRNSGSYDRARPMVLGLTASPIYGGNPDAAFDKLEHNLDSIIRSSRMHREELAQYVHRPVFKHVLHSSPSYDWETLPSYNTFSLKTVVDSLNIEHDPYVQSMRGQLARAHSAEERHRIDQKLSKVIHKADTFTHRGLRDFLRAAEEICMELGEWAADWYIVKVIEQARRAANPYNNIMTSWQANEKRYLLDNLDKVNVVPVSTDPDEIRHMLTPKVQALVSCLVTEEEDFRLADETYSGLIFVTRRDTVIALAEVLSRLPETAQLFRIGCLLGSSSSFKRHSFLDITREIVKESQVNTLAEFRGGDKNLIVSTSVAEEGIDIQACGSVIRFDAPPNVVSWAQSRGRARQQRSSFIMMLEQDSQHEQDIQKWIGIEQQMMDLYTDPNRVAPETFEEDDDHDERTYLVESTGAVLTLDSVTSHLNHFCSVLPNASYGGQHALYDLDPPDYPEDWHSQQDRLKDMPPYQGPWGATVTLPRCLPSHLRKFATPREHKTKRSAQKHAAFNAYVALHEAKLLNDHLLPLMSAIEPDKGEEVKKLLADIEKRAGTEKVSIQTDPWAPKADEDTWWKAEMVIDGLPALTMLTPNPLPAFAEEEMPTIYIPGRGATHVLVRPMGKVGQDEAYLERARTYSHRMFSTLYFARMKPDDRAFAYLFLPAEEGPDEHSWEDRRKWMQERIDRGTDVRLETNTRANADMLRQQYGLPTDLALIRPNEKFGKPFQFVRWFNGPLSTEDEDKLRERYDGFPDATTTYPLLQVKEFPQRANFLAPLASDTAGLGRDEAVYLLPKYTTVELVSKEDLQYAMYLPSILRWMSNALTVVSLRNELLPADSVAKVAFDLLRIATTAPVAQEMMVNDQPLNYQRLETLGDCVLKCLTSTQLFADHPFWHEGYLARRKDHAVSNVQLAKAAIEKGLYKWIIRDRFVPRKWKPRYLSDSVVNEPEPEPESKPEPKPAEEETKDEGNKKKRKKKQTQELSTKVLADVVESLLGAAYEHGGFDLAVECAALFGLGLSWKKLTTHIDEVLARHEELDVPPPQLTLVERMIGYNFTRKALLIQALTHASYTGDLATMSYERLEFLGDCALDMIVTDMLYHAEGWNYKPGHMHLRKEGLVNSHFLAYFCLKTFTTCESPNPSWSPTSGVTVGTEEQKIYLWQCLLHSSHRVLEDQNVTSTRFEKIGPEIEKALKQKTIYPWAALTSLQAPKFLSDMVESLLGAVFLDSEGDFTAVCDVLRTLGIMDVLERIITRNEMDVLHPISRLSIWAAQQDPQQKVKLAVEKTKGNVSCAVILDGEELLKVTEVYRSRASQEEVRFAAAEQAIKKLRVLEEEEEEDAIDEEDNTWGDEVPEYEW
ncbi:P-loop containing nucleoside triphosphate hydrolase protein [Fomitopsis serialis]|uniref:P-loop containing nucleoside triphosphate hydrolase protein n=1 Tax=Fomitopsis serialis TaxID=139415 RepID=UPI0020077C96|nr:P-loop containing nucleoside triphosphate hydrolase protein [Neoantrodia serialis]KAH9936593.1 P-loop containing nucleoside triphosphate hydrolase protein [Neoantrodia serialis]